MIFKRLSLIATVGLSQELGLIQTPLAGMARFPPNTGVWERTPQAMRIFYKLEKSFWKKLSTFLQSLSIVANVVTVDSSVL